MAYLMNDAEFARYLEAVGRRIDAHTREYTPPTAADRQTLRGSLWLTCDDVYVKGDKTPCVAVQGDLRPPPTIGTSERDHRKTTAM
jgi:hypothetical protein